MDELYSDEIMLEMIKRMSNIDLLIIEILSKKKTFNAQTSIDKKTIFEEIPNLTDFCFQISIKRLELALIINRVSFSKRNRYYLTEIGYQILHVYKKSVSSMMKKFK